MQFLTFDLPLIFSLDYVFCPVNSVDGGDYYYEDETATGKDPTGIEDDYYYYEDDGVGPEDLGQQQQPPPNYDYVERRITEDVGDTDYYDEDYFADDKSVSCF